MVHSLSTPCWESDHNMLVLQLGAPMILLYIVGIPLTLIGILHQNQDMVRCHIQNAKLDAVTEQRHLSFRETYSFLYRGYRFNTYWWEIVYIFRKALITAISVFFPNDYNTQGVFAILVLVVAVTVHLSMSPFHQDVFNQLELFSLWSTLVIFMCGQLTFTDSIYQSDVSAAASVTALAIMIMYLVVMLGIFAWLCFKEIRSSRRRDNSPDHKFPNHGRDHANNFHEALPREVVHRDPVHLQVL